jgi:hypothetical protein
MSEVAGQSPERGQPHPQAFNLGALSVNDVVRLNLALRFEEAHQFDLNRGLESASEEENCRLITLLRGAIERLAADDLDRAKEVVVALKSDHSEINERRGWSQDMAAECMPGFLPHDYEFARDTLLDLRYEDRYSEAMSPDTAMGVIAEFEEQLAPEQRADFDLHVQQREAW